jgi:hypothetical protein
VELRVNRCDLRIEHMSCRPSQVCFEKLTDKVQRAIIAIGTATFCVFDRPYTTIYPPKPLIPPASPQKSELYANLHSPETE